MSCNATHLFGAVNSFMSASLADSWSPAIYSKHVMWCNQSFYWRIQQFHACITGWSWIAIKTPNLVMSMFELCGTAFLTRVMVITLLAEGTHYSINAIEGNVFLTWLGQRCAVLFLFRRCSCWHAFCTFTRVRRVLNSILIAIQAWVSSFQSRNPNLANMPLQMALNAHFMREDGNSQKCVYVCVSVFEVAYKTQQNLC